MRTIIRHIKPYGVTMFAKRHPDGTYGAYIPMLHVEGKGDRLKTAVLEALFELLEMADKAQYLVSRLVPRRKWGQLSNDDVALAMLALAFDALAHYASHLDPHRSKVANLLSAYYLMEAEQQWKQQQQKK